MGGQDVAYLDINSPKGLMDYEETRIKNTLLRSCQAYYRDCKHDRSSYAGNIDRTRWRITGKEGKRFWWRKWHDSEVEIDVQDGTQIRKQPHDVKHLHQASCGKVRTIIKTHRKFHCSTDSRTIKGLQTLPTNSTAKLLWAAKSGNTFWSATLLGRYLKRYRKQGH
jgi:hypothetical protein